MSLMPLFEAIASGDTATALRLLASDPRLAAEPLQTGATRQVSTEFFFDSIGHYVYEGDTALHVAAAAYQLDVTRRLIALDADVRARNRRGAEPLHYAADGAPGGPSWNPK